jgi:gliding motility-associated-like protein
MKKILFLFIAFYALNLSAQDNDTCQFSVKIESSDWINPIGELDACYDFDLDAITSNSQNDSLFEWTYLDTLPTGVKEFELSNQKSLTYKFSKLGTYPLRLRAVDKNGCVAYDSLKVIFDNPGVEASQLYYEDGRSLVPELLKVCASDTITIIPGYTSGDSLTNFYQPISWNEVGGESFGDGIYLPDGSGAVYKTNFNVSGFDEMTVLGVGDSIKVCVNIEHSYLGDLEMALTSPNGKKVQLFDDMGTTTDNYWLGVPNDNDYLSQDTIKAGDCWEYCWSMDPQFDIITSSLENTTNSIDSMGNVGKSMISGAYKPAQDFSGFNGSPVNGDWTLTITDYLEEDNGFICSWNLFINIEGETELNNAKIIDFTWDCPQEPSSILYPDTDSTQLVLHPTTSGLHTYVMTVVDNHGCDYQKEFELDVFTGPLAASNNIEFCDKKVDLIGSRFLDQDSVLWEVMTDQVGYNFLRDDRWYKPGFFVKEFGPYQLKFTDLICETSDTLDIEFTQKVAELTYEPLVRDDMETLVKAKSWADDGQWVTTGNEGRFDSEDSLETTFRVDEYGDYLLAYTGCDTTIAFNILFMEDLSVSNVITPNGDGDNDFFTITDLTEEYYSYSNMSIFNRWGVEVYRNGSYGIDGSMWDGQSTHQNDELPNGAYFYVLKVGNKVTKQEEVYKGAVQLYR